MNTSLNACISKDELKLYADSLNIGDKVKAVVGNPDATIPNKIVDATVVEKYPFICRVSFRRNGRQQEATLPWIDLYMQNYFGYCTRTMKQEVFA